jgi:hypothetical protein
MYERERGPQHLIQKLNSEDGREGEGDIETHLRVEKAHGIHGVTGLRTSLLLGHLCEGRGKCELLNTSEKKLSS